MKLATSILIAITATTAAIHADAATKEVKWDEDPRCRRNRKLYNPNEPDPQLVEDGLTIEGIRSRPRNTSNEAPPPPETRRLRGRKLGSDTKFQLKMYHEKGYCWQDEWDDPEWCLECEGRKCGEDDYLWIKRCDEDEDEQWFVYREISGTGGGQLSPYERQDLCWERTRVNAHQLRPCDDDERKQIIKGIQYDGKFEMHPNGRPDDCLEQHHDPKSEEVSTVPDKYNIITHTSFNLSTNLVPVLYRLFVPTTVRMREATTQTFGS
jgi:hypothetical protein